MEKMVTEMLDHMSQSTYQLARVLDAERHVTVRLSQIVQALPDENPHFGGTAGIIENTQGIAQNIVAYLNSFADFQETIAEQLTFVIRELKEADAEE
ncbi:nucleoside-diphosphate sugar epimerase [Paenibacillus alkaliterrae]|uniref:nucleoside-diphosphate sugar epimerase n=1 Tax=Paenibacillus alkaliterrae TaxID=320909 RepID=UPI001F47194D|nr:nucleoside-diphosphate sugar epimerase [Paenibacillus alkaliterrae]MCF2938571.1 nucleoside-diphosphate sugar epimerase [Paenibacillus alkaliterrae]